MKLIKKSDCVFKNGYIFKADGSEVVSPESAVVLQLIKLETGVQQADYLRSQDPFSPGPTLDGWKRKSIRDGKWKIDAPETPVHDARVKEAEAFMDEADELAKHHDVQKALDMFGDLLDWVDADEFVAFDGPMVIDTPVLGNPLELETEDVVAMICELASVPVPLGPHAGVQQRIQADFRKACETHMNEDGDLA